MNRKALLIAYLTSAFVLVHFLFSFNFNSVIDWKQDADTKEMMLDFGTIIQNNHSQKNITLTSSVWLTEGVDYYKSIHYLPDLVDSSSEESIQKQINYFYLTPEDFSKTNNDSLEIIKVYPVTKNILVKKK